MAQVVIIYTNIKPTVICWLHVCMVLTSQEQTKDFNNLVVAQYANIVVSVPSANRFNSLHHSPLQFVKMMISHQKAISGSTC